MIVVHVVLPYPCFFLKSIVVGYNDNRDVVPDGVHERYGLVNVHIRKVRVEDDAAKPLI